MERNSTPSGGRHGTTALNFYSSEFLHGTEYFGAICPNQTWPCLTLTSQQHGDWNRLVYMLLTAAQTAFRFTVNS